MSQTEARAIREIQEMVAARCGVTLPHLLRGKRTDALEARSLAMALVAELLELTPEQVAGVFAVPPEAAGKALRTVESAEVQGGNQVAKLLAQLRFYAGADPVVRQARVAAGLEQPEEVDHAA